MTSEKLSDRYDSGARQDLDFLDLPPEVLARADGDMTRDKQRARQDDLRDFMQFYGITEMTPELWLKYADSDG